MKTHCLLSQCCEEYIVSNGSLNSSFFILLKPTCWQCLVSVNWPHCACRASHLHAHILRVPFSPDGALGHFSSDATGLPALVMSPGSHISCTDLRNVLFPSPGQCLLAFCSHLSILPACLPASSHSEVTDQLLLILVLPAAELFESVLGDRQWKPIIRIFYLKKMVLKKSKTGRQAHQMCSISELCNLACCTTTQSDTPYK